MPERSEVLEGTLDPGALIRQHHVRDDARNLAIEEDERPRERRQAAGQPRLVLVDQRHEQPIDASLAKGLERQLLPRDVPAGARDHEADARPAEVFLDHLGDLAEDVVADCGDEKPDEPAARRAEAASCVVGAEIEARDSLENPLPGQAGDVRGAVQDTRDRGFRDVRLPRHVENG